PGDLDPLGRALGQPLAAGHADHAVALPGGLAHDAGDRLARDRDPPERTSERMLCLHRPLGRGTAAESCASRGSGRRDPGAAPASSTGATGRARPDPVLVRTYLKLGLEVVVVVLGIGTLAGFLDAVSWVFEPATLFRLQYVVLLAAVAAIALVL